MFPNKGRQKNRKNMEKILSQKLFHKICLDMIHCNRAESIKNMKVVIKPINSTSKQDTMVSPEDTTRIAMTTTEVTVVIVEIVEEEVEEEVVTTIEEEATEVDVAVVTEATETTTKTIHTETKEEITRTTTNNKGNSTKEVLTSIFPVYKTIIFKDIMMIMKCLP